MVKARIERTVDVPIERAWELLSDFSHVQKIHPLVGKVDKQTTQDRGVGAIRKCHMYDGNEAVERIEEWDEQNHFYKIKLLDGTLPMKSIDVLLRAEPVGSFQTKLVADMDLQAKYGCLGKIMERLVIKPQLGGAVGNLFAGLEEFDKTGKEIQKGYKAKTPAIVV